MEFEKLIEERRSIRNFAVSEDIDRNVIKEFIKAALQAPSWKNSQTARYYCALSNNIKERLRTECLPEFNAKNSENALALIVTTFVKDRAGFNADGEPSNELGNGWGCYDLGLQNENLILRAKELGFGTLIMGIRDAKKISNILNIPDSEAVVSVIALGRYDNVPKKPERKTTDEILKFY